MSAEARLSAASKVAQRTSPVEVVIFITMVTIAVALLLLA
jgi:hypothetical protein